jgi:hypothetical protein
VFIDPRIDQLGEFLTGQWFTGGIRRLDAFAGAA